MVRLASGLRQSVCQSLSFILISRNVRALHRLRNRGRSNSSDNHAAVALCTAERLSRRLDGGKLELCAIREPPIRMASGLRQSVRQSESFILISRNVRALHRLRNRGRSKSSGNRGAETLCTADRLSRPPTGGKLELCAIRKPLVRLASGLRQSVRQSESFDLIP